MHGKGCHSLPTKFVIHLIIILVKEIHTLQGKKEIRKKCMKPLRHPRSPLMLTPIIFLFPYLFKTRRQENRKKKSWKYENNERNGWGLVLFLYINSAYLLEEKLHLHSIFKLIRNKKKKEFSYLQRFYSRPWHTLTHILSLEKTKLSFIFT